jgi:peptidyl-Lys metalloendopeptidase
MRSTVRVAAVALLLAVSACASEDGTGAPLPGDQGPTAGLTSRIEVLNDWLGQNDQLEVRWTLTNDGRETVWLPRWQAPTAALEADLFDVQVDGASVPYVGRVYKRATPSAADMVAIAPGLSLSAVVPVSQFYRTGQAGEYALQQHVHAGDLAVTSNAVRAVRFENAVEPDAGIHADLVAPGFIGCSSSEQSKINSALSGAASYAANAASYVNGGSHNARYTTWFGTYTSNRFSTIQAHYTSIKSTVDNKKITVNCDCNDSAYAYVYPNQPYTIYVCNAFWSAPTTGTDSKAGTLIHELSHFYAVASTDDWAYGQSAAKSLAKNNPSKAVDNADSHEYFAENNPGQN